MIVTENKVQALRGRLSSFHIPDDNFKGEDVEDEGNLGVTDECGIIRRYNLPIINIEARSYHKIVDLNSKEIKQPPAIKSFSDLDIDDILNTPLKLDYPCHNQSVERHVKLVTEASSQVAGFERRDDLIRQKIRSRKLMKVLNTKKEFS